MVALVSEFEPKPVSPTDDEADTQQAEESTPELESALNNSLEDVLNLLTQQVEKLHASLAFVRMSERTDKQTLERWHVQQIDQRQDRIAEIQAMILADHDGPTH